MKDKIIKFIEDSEEYPDMYELVNEFVGTLHLFDNVKFFKDFVELIQDQRIIYESGAWISISIHDTQDVGK